MSFEEIADRVYRYVDTCNVYVLTAGRGAVLIDFGSGSVVDHLHEIGVERIDWVLHTHHHRDQCQGDFRLIGTDTQIGVPAGEAHLFEDVETFWQRKNTYDMYELSSDFNSLRHNVPVNRRFRDYETFEWQDLTLLVQPTPGHTKGAVTYLASIGGHSIAFCGDVIYSPGRVWTLHDLQWDYGRPDGLNVALAGVHALRLRNPEYLAPAHGELIDSGAAALALLEDNMLQLFRIIGEHYEVNAEFPFPPSVDSRMAAITEHLIAAAHPTANFYVLRADNGEVLFFDYGFPSMDHVTGNDFRFIEHSLHELRELFGIDRADVVIPSHYHDDHVAGFNFLRTTRGAEVWAYENFVDILEHPEAYRIPCLWPEPIEVRRAIGEGERVTWNGFSFDAFHNPGHTWWAVSLFGEVDGKRIAIAGDEILRNGFGGFRGCGPIYRNRVRSNSFTEGMRKIIDFEPDYLLTGHSGAIEITAAQLDEAYRWSLALEGTWRTLAAFPDEIEFALDPDFVTIYPYQTNVAPGEGMALAVEITNHHSHAANGRLTMILPDLWIADPRVVEFELESGASRRFEFEVMPDPHARQEVRHVLTADLALGEHRFGEIAEALVVISQ